ncbi:hypothetical protein HYQ45_012893 [Verticillium longisporum]|uniref:Nicotianamine synthase n=1 Tax=Verticillium longisporum TaxID=100787 RepID=A0A8I2ZDI8_VERLO|nr:hypothetical protein HYQ44_016881 [Verticillium longisporum]KAG7126466.1 hypothetical protein HYQ45_012893 [Verticillium longisporum]KAG7153213.1 hypothetical protein HYQ46_003715 [Verticillium longisporum]
MTVTQLFPADPAAAVQHHIGKIKRATEHLESLYPLDSVDKVNAAIPHWNELYGVIGFTTVDTDVEQRLLKHPDVISLMPSTRRAVLECEAAFEIAFANEIADARESSAARKSLSRFPIHAFYEHAAELEWTAASTVLGRTPRSVAILGAGALPETCIWIQDWARARGERIHVHSVELLPSRLELSQRAMITLALDCEDTTYEAGDARTAPRDLRSFDAVYFNATVGSTAEEKEAVLLEVAGRMTSGAVMVSRGSTSLKSLFYPPTVMNSPKLMKRLMPVLTCHMNGEKGRSINTSIIVSRVI